MVGPDIGRDITRTPLSKQGTRKSVNGVKPQVNECSMYKLKERARTGTAGALSPAGAEVGASPCDWASDCRVLGSDCGSVVVPSLPVLVVSAYAGAVATVTSGACQHRAGWVLGHSQMHLALSKECCT